MNTEDGWEGEGWERVGGGGVVRSRSGTVAEKVEISVCLSIK